MAIGFWQSSRACDFFECSVHYMILFSEVSRYLLLGFVLVERIFFIQRESVGEQRLLKLHCQRLECCLLVSCCLFRKFALEFVVGRSLDFEF